MNMTKNSILPTTESMVADTAEQLSDWTEQTIKLPCKKYLMSLISRQPPGKSSQFYIYKKERKAERRKEKR